ncbi:hypothetical protein AG0111_0g13061 [Alternaria gaisen]|uniref:Uncharacterized protein n=1 Tax=Alternaria gaisen TaxID=167740 RepID=A0ACB6F2T9_9PLEO|nr:hypothetical protein AG0111_0g13061 [Alternaria gaisen]
MHRHATYPYTKPALTNPAPTPIRYSGTPSAFSALAPPNEDWTKTLDLAGRRRIQNRIAQRNYRKKLKQRIEDLERHDASSSASPEQKDRPFDENFIALHTITGRERTGNDYIARLLIEDKDMRSVCSKLLEKFDREEFVEIGREELRRFHSGLVKSAKTDLEQQGARLLRSHSGRKRICEAMADIITSGEFQDEEAMERTDDQTQSEVNSEVTLRQSAPYTRTQPNPSSLLQQDSVNHYRDWESEPESEDEDLRDMAELKKFFRQSNSFQMLLNELRMQLLPQSLRGIMRTALCNSLSLSKRNNNSLANRMKVFVEDFTMLEWNWWPLKSRMGDMSSIEMRLLWLCTCGTRLWQNISTDHANLIIPMLPHGISKSNMLRRCKRNRSFKAFLAKLITSAALQSAAGKKHIPLNITATSSSAVETLQDTGVGSSAKKSREFTQTKRQVASSGVQITMGQQAGLNNSQILFEVKGPHPALKLEQISTKNSKNDSNFYSELKKYYRLNRGRLRYWFSFWRLGYCEVVKTYRPNYVLMEEKELPTSKDYEYIPRPPDASNPPIS